MTLSGEFRARRVANAKAIAALGVSVDGGEAGTCYRTVRPGRKTTLYTIGYERRDGEGLMAALLDAGVTHLADVRDKPMSRKPDFRGKALRSFCENAGIEYGAWSELGSTEEQRQRLHETGDLVQFHKHFRAYSLKSLNQPIARLAEIVKQKNVALMCYERAHEECHRSVVADLIANLLDAEVVAIQ